tara:strand:+ start:737 stop:1474 length:738 start_codon:yes stop_codon:yes gene_type:complete
MSEENNTTQPTEGAPEATPIQEPVPQVSLDKEAEAAAMGQPDGFKLDTLNDIQDVAMRKEFQAYTSRAVNDAKAAWEAKHATEMARLQQASPSNVHNPSPSQGGEYISREELGRVMQQKDAEAKLQYEAKSRLNNVFSDLGITADGPRHAQVVNYYQQQKEAGQLDANVLLSESGIRSIIHASGALLPDAAGPSAARSVRKGTPAYDVPGRNEIQLGGAAPTEKSDVDPGTIARARMQEFMDKKS